MDPFFLTCFSFAMMINSAYSNSSALLPTSVLVPNFTTPSSFPSPLLAIPNHPFILRSMVLMVSTIAVVLLMQYMGHLLGEHELQGEQEAEESPILPVPTADNFNNVNLNESEIFTFTSEDFELGTLIGNGFFGKTYRAILKHQVPDPGFAVRVLNKTPTALESVHKEIHAQGVFSHKTFLEIFSYFVDDEKIYLVMQLPKQQISECLSIHHCAAKYIKDLIHALISAREHGVIYRRVSTERLFVGYEDQILIGDFGWWSVFEDRLRHEEDDDIKDILGVAETLLGNTHFNPIAKTFLTEDHQDLSSMLSHAWLHA